jgi:glycosyltransferase involved in cell wall biosynthesis
MDSYGIGTATTPLYTQQRGSLAETFTGLVDLDVKSVTTTVVVPAYNEAEALPHVLDSLFAILPPHIEAVVVDDGSTDATTQVASRYPCRVIRHAQNGGKGAAMRTGISMARGDKVIFIDADNTYPTEMIVRISNLLDRFQFVRCVRDEGRENIPLTNRVGNWLFDHLIRGVFNLREKDVLTGLYGLHKDALERMGLESTGFDIETEIVVKAHQMELSTFALPTAYNERVGEKKLRPFHDGLVILRRILALFMACNPLLFFVVPGLLIWLVAGIAFSLFSNGQLHTQVTTLATNSLITASMAFLAGFQVIVFGFIATLYVQEAHIKSPPKVLLWLADNFPRTLGAFASLSMIVLGAFGSAKLVLGWVLNRFGPFENSQMLLASLLLLVWGAQLLSTMLIFSLVVSHTRRVKLPAAIVPVQ